MKAKTRTVADQPCWTLRSDEVELNVTQLGGQMAPVTFFRKSDKPVQPYYISPWQGEGLEIDEPVLVPLRGDFFCMPFGANGKVGSVTHFVHGETATCNWTLADSGTTQGVTSLTLGMKTRKLAGQVTKRLCLVDGQNVVYQQDRLEGYSCRTSIGHHATLAVPDADGAMQIATSPTLFGMTNPVATDDPAGGEYSSLAFNKRFEKLDKVPLKWKDPAYGDFSSLPAREGFTDLLGVFNKPGGTPAWTTAAIESQGYLWFALKDAAVLPTTMLWVSNRGRHQSPWNGRNRCLGLEDVCGFFAEGLPESIRKNALDRAGVPTCVKLTKKTPLAVNYIQGVARIPRGFRKVRSVKFTPGQVTFNGAGGKKVAIEVSHEFLTTGEL